MATFGSGLLSLRMPSTLRLKDFPIWISTTADMCPSMLRMLTWCWRGWRVLRRLSTDSERKASIRSSSRLWGENLVVATTKLSQLVTGRYELVKSWGLVSWIFRRLRPAVPVRLADFEPAVRPSFAPHEPLPEDSEMQAFERGVEWYGRAGLFVHSSWEKTVAERSPLDGPSPAPPPECPLGDGSEGLLGGFSTVIEYGGRQLLGWRQRNDCMGETSMAMEFPSP